MSASKRDEQQPGFAISEGATPFPEGGPMHMAEISPVVAEGFPKLPATGYDEG